MLERLDSLPWHRINHIYGPATDLPDALCASIAGGTFHEEAYWEFFNLICHQGTTSAASSAVVPFLVELATDPTTPSPEYFFLALAEIAADPDNHAPHDCVADVLPTIFPYLKHATPALRAGAAHVLGQFPEEAETIAPCSARGLQQRIASPAAGGTSGCPLPRASDVLVAEISGGTITALAGQSSILDGVQRGYQTASSFNASLSQSNGYDIIQASGTTFTPYYVAQTTQYIYGTAVTSSSPDLYCNNIVTAIAYPDSTGGTDEVKYTYDRQGEMTSMEDQNRTTHDYAFDGAGRLLSDSVTVASRQSG